jgi:hypothetical protein
VCQSRLSARIDDDRVTNWTTSTWTDTSDRALPRGVIAGVGVVGLLLLVVAARTKGYWQGLRINLGTGALLFAALEHMLDKYGVNSLRQVMASRGEADVG